MKTKLITFAVLFLASTVFVSCKKDEVIELLPNMSATVDGTAWEATPSVVTGTNYDDYFTFLGYNLNGNKMLIVVDRGGDAISTGTYTINLNPFDGEGVLNLPTLATYGLYMEDKDAGDDSQTNYYSTSGSVVVTAVDDDRIDGTFSFTAVNNAAESIEITNGAFSNVKIRN